MVTIKDIARATSLSTSTVSRALNQHPAISQATRDLVLKCAEELHYTPNHHARSLVRRRSNTIGFMIPDIADNYFSISATGVENVLFRNGYDIVYTNTDRKPERLFNFLERAREHQYAGVMITPDAWTEGLIDKIHALGMPAISLRRKSPYTQPEIPYVDSDHYTGFREATGYLCSMGHKSIGLITADTLIYNERQTGYEEALRQFRLAPVMYRFPNAVPGSERYKAGYMAAEYLMKDRPLTAIIATDDRFAIGTMEYLNTQGLKVPQDVSVIGCDDRPEGQLYPFRLTTIKQDIVELGRNAGRMIMRMIEEEDYVPVSISLKPRLVVRSTTGAAKR